MKNVKTALAQYMISTFYVFYMCVKYPILYMQEWENIYLPKLLDQPS